MTLAGSVAQDLYSHANGKPATPHISYTPAACQAHFLCRAPDHLSGGRGLTLRVLK